MHPRPEDREAARQWARALLASEFYLLDTETTGLNRDEPDFPIELAVLDKDGNVVIETRIRPPKSIPAAASGVHHIFDADVEAAPTFDQIWPRLAALRDKKFLIYNASYDQGILRTACRHYGLLDEDAVLTDAECVMLQHARWFGDWNESRGTYRWQRLQGGDHSARGDCLATLALVRRMAE